jgi:hypothetical protein
MNASNATVRSRAGPRAHSVVSKDSAALQRPGIRDLAGRSASYPLPDFLQDQRSLLKLLGIHHPSELLTWP